ncbi:MAG: phosphate ABC transporter permease [Gammaproteobacteria bacterium GWF2_41_13]|nr:MAG: phosphate ABC transporter permease [Gammaproteobacteria bacterium GWF2_41_13]
MKSENTLVIEAGRAEKHYWLDLWRYRELFYILSWRDITVRYKQTIIGVLWAILKPFLTMIVFTIIFGRLAKLPSDGNTPYAIMVYAAMIPWQFFSSAVSDASNSLVDNAQLITKIYFPRIIIPISSIVTNFIDFLISFVILIILMIYFKFMPSWHIIFLPFFVLILLFTAASIGVYITALNVKFRDFRYVIPFLVQFGLYISPVGFSSSVVPEKYRLLYSLNPMVGVIDGFRWAILGGKSPFYLYGFIISLGIICSFLVLGIYIFRKTEKTFADII